MIKKYLHMFRTRKDIYMPIISFKFIPYTIKYNKTLILITVHGKIRNL